MTPPLHVYRTSPKSLRLAHVIESTRSEGPAVRFAVWLQGCELHCPGCCNPELFDFDAPTASDVPISALLDRLQRAATEHTIEGITLLGGEPFHQAPAATAFAHAAHGLDLGVMVFTGYELDVLEADPIAQSLLAETDLLVAGPFVASARSATRPWIGSDNQRLHFLTERYREHPDVAARYAQSVHVQCLDGELRVSGWPGVVDAVRKRSPGAS